MQRCAPLLLLPLVGCAGQGALATKKPTRPPDAVAAPFVSPARWDYHPGAPDVPMAALELEHGSCLLTAVGGQRWLVTPDAKTTTDASAAGTALKQPPGVSAPRFHCAGHAEASSILAREELLGITGGPSGYRFLGASGSIYRADTALGAFTRTDPPASALARVAGAGPHVLGLSFDGAIQRWEEGAGFRLTSPVPARFFDVAIDEQGHALALAFPEALFTSADGGATWAQAKAKVIGARRVGRTGSGDLAAEGLFESLVFHEGAPPKAIPEAAVASPVALDIDVGASPSATAVSSGRAVLDAERYVEALRPLKEDTGATNANAAADWRLARGKLDGKLEIIAFPNTHECAGMRLGLRASTIIAGCVITKGDKLTLRIRKSKDFGATWGEAIEVAASDPELGGVAVSLDGTALLSGVCKDIGPPCKPTAPVLVRDEGGKLRAVSTAAPQLGGTATLPTFSADGHSAYFLGKRGKDDRITLFVSHDAGESFSQRTLVATVPHTAPRENDEGEDEPQTEPQGETDLDSEDTSELRASDDGTIGVNLKGRTWVYLTLDEDGRVLETGVPPVEEAMISGFGRRLVAVGPMPASDPRNGSDGDRFALWESSDAGASWQPQAAPLALAQDFYKNPTIHCSAYGCLIGETLSRIGWGGQLEGEGPDRPTETPPPTSPYVQTPIVCELAASARWTRIDQVHPHGSGGALPTFAEAMRGRSVWSVVTEDLQTGAVGTVSATLPDGRDGEARLVTKQLLSPTSGHFASTLSHQIEGYFAVRVPIPVDAKGQPKIGAPMHGIELGWENFHDGALGRATIADAGPLEKDDILVGSGSIAMRPALVTVSVRSAYVRPHHAGSKNQTAYFIDAGGKEQHFTFPTMSPREVMGAAIVAYDAATIDGHPYEVGLVHENNAGTGWITNLLLAKKKEHSQGGADDWDVTATAIAPNRSDGPFLVRTDWSYLGKSTIGITSLVSDPRTGHGWAYFSAFREDGSASPALLIPTAQDLGERPRPCSAAERQSSPRVEALSVSLPSTVLVPGTRHPVLVSEPPQKGAVGVTAPLTLLTSAAIAHGTPANPCVAAFEADPLSDAANTAVAILSGDLAHSWLFRKTDASGRRAWPSVEVRPMTCHYDPNAKVPETVWNQPGTSR